MQQQEDQFQQPDMMGQPDGYDQIDPNQQMNADFMMGQPGMPDYQMDDGQQNVFNPDQMQQPMEDMGEGEEVDDYFDDAGDIGYLPADHPLMARLQAALTKQLTDEHERVDL